jgi:long-chain fatty acid transport protein
LRTRITSGALIAALLVIGAGTAFGAGFEVAEQSARLMGSSFAGKAAEADEASIVFFNPAGMAKLRTINVVAAIQAIIPTAKFKDSGSAGLFGPLTGGDGGDPGGVLPVPNLYATMPLSERFSVGLAVNVPYGLETKYDSTWQGRYHAIESALSTINVNPGVSFRVDDRFSIGAGISYNHASAKLTNAVDYGTIGAGAGLTPERHDGVASLEGTSDGWGWNVGVMLELTEYTRIGLSYRSRIPHRLRGDAEFGVPDEAEILTSGGMFTDTKGSADLNLPAQIYLSAFHEIDEQWAILGDITWTQWSEFKELRIRFDNPVQPDKVTPENWEDVFRFSAGARFRPSDDWTIRFGLAYDQSPISHEYRTPRIPTNDRWWITFGVGWQISQTVAVDVSYMHVFISDGPVDQTTVTGQRLKGTFEGSANVLGAQLTLDF